MRRIRPMLNELDTFEAGTLRKHFTLFGETEVFVSILLKNAINFKEN